MSLNRWEKAELDIKKLYTDGVDICESGDLDRLQEWWVTRPRITMDMLMCGFDYKKWLSTLLSTQHRVPASSTAEEPERRISRVACRAEQRRRIVTWLSTMM